MPVVKGQSVDLAAEVTHLRGVVAQLAARRGDEPSQVRAREAGPAIDQINAEFFSDAAAPAQSDDGHPNNQQNPHVTTDAGGSGGCGRRSEINARSIRNQCEISAGINAGAMRDQCRAMKARPRNRYEPRARCPLRPRMHRRPRSAGL